MKLFHRIGLCLAAAAAMFFSFGEHAYAQQQTLKGVVIDQDGEPIMDQSQKYVSRHIS